MLSGAEERAMTGGARFRRVALIVTTAVLLPLGLAGGASVTASASMVTAPHAASSKADSLAARRALVANKTSLAVEETKSPENLSGLAGKLPKLTPKQLQAEVAGERATARSGVAVPSAASDVGVVDTVSMDGPSGEIAHSCLKLCLPDWLPSSEFTVGNVFPSEVVTVSALVWHYAYRASAALG